MAQRYKFSIESKSFPPRYIGWARFSTENQPIIREKRTLRCVKVLFLSIWNFVSWWPAWGHKVIPLGFEPKTHSLEGCCSNPTELRNLQIDCKGNVFFSITMLFSKFFCLYSWKCERFIKKHLRSRLNTRCRTPCMDPFAAFSSWCSLLFLLLVAEYLAPFRLLLSGPP